MKKIVIAIDGYSACGKSSTAKAVALNLGYAYLDSGAMYRAVTLYFHEHFVNLENPVSIRKALENIHINFIYNPKTGKNETFLNGLNVEEEIRKMYISDKVSEVSTIADVRYTLVTIQKKLGKAKGVVMDGRDIGTTVFPDAELKIFMEADLELRAYRRQQELLASGYAVDIDEIIENLKKRDLIDTTRKESPLTKAEDAYVINSSYLSFDEQVERVIELATSKMVNIENVKV